MNLRNEPVRWSIAVITFCMRRSQALPCRLEGLLRKYLRQESIK